MITKCYHTIVFLVLLVTSVLSAQQPLTISGRLFSTDGRPAAYAEACLYADTFENVSTKRLFPQGALCCVKTDKAGTYYLTTEQSLPVTLIAHKDKTWALHRPQVTTTTSDTIYINDTLKTPGSLHFTIQIENRNDHLARLSLEGTPFTFYSNRSGKIALTAIPPGAYAAVLKSLSEGYQTVRCTLRIEAAEISQLTDTLTIPQEIFKPSLAKDTIAELRHNTNSTISPKPSIQVTVHNFPAAQNSPHEQKIAPPPPTQTPIKPTPKFASSPPTVSVPADTFIGLFDTLTLVGKASDNGTIIATEWDIGGTGSYTRTTNGVIIIPPYKQPQTRVYCIFRATDNDGETTIDTTVVYVRLLWTSISPPENLLGRNGHSLLCFHNAYWIIGGNRSDVWRSADGVSWTLMTDTAPFGKLFGHTTTAFNNRLWIVGGKTSVDKFSSAIWSSGEGVNWRREATLPFEPRLYHSATYYNNKLWIIGGLSGSENEPMLNDVWSTDDGINWHGNSSSAPFQQRYGHGCVVFNNALCLAGGFNDALDKQTSYNDVWTSVDGVTWKQLTNAAPFSAEQYHSFVTQDNLLWAVGGYQKEGTTDVFLDILSTADGVSWNRLTVPTTSRKRFFCTAIPYGNKIMISPSESHKLWIMR